MFEGDLIRVAPKPSDPGTVVAEIWEPTSTRWMRGTSLEEALRGSPVSLERLREWFGLDASGNPIPIKLAENKE